MDIALDDKKVCKTKLLIQEKNNYLENNLKNLKKTQSDNIFLAEVVDDYIKYFSLIKNQKEQQYEALRKITDYIDNINKTNDITEHLLRESKQDQLDILQRMKAIKHKIDSITSIIES